MRPRFALALLCASLAVLAAACGGDDTPAPTEATATPVIIPTATPFAQLPAPVIVTAVAGPSAGVDLTYIVEPGDSLSVIAARFGTTVEAISEANGLDDPDIIVGQELIIPGGDGAAPTTDDAAPAPAATNAPEASDSVYVVEAGDTALGVAIRFGVTLEELAAANGMTVDEITNLRIGQELQLPQ